MPQWRRRGAPSLLATLVVVAAALLAGCSRRSDTPIGRTTRWFGDHRTRLDRTRQMLEEDGALVSYVGYSPLGLPRSIAGTKGQCGSKLRGGELPWTCSDGQTRASYAGVESFLGLAPGRIEAYRAVEAIDTSRAEACDPPGSVTIWLEDPDAAPCTSSSNLVWSPTPTPTRSTDSACGRTVVTQYVDLGGGWYADACVDAPAAPGPRR